MHLCYYLLSFYLVAFGQEMLACWLPMCQWLPLLLDKDGHGYSIKFLLAIPEKLFSPPKFMTLNDRSEQGFWQKKIYFFIH